MHYPQCETCAIMQACVASCLPTDPILYYGSFPILGHDHSRDIDVLAVSLRIEDAVRIRLPSTCDPHQPINIYVVPNSALILDLEEFRYGGWWVSKPLLCAVEAHKRPDVLQLKANAVACFATRAGIELKGNLQEDGRRVAAALCIRYPTFAKSALATYRHPDRRAVFENQLHDARRMRRSVALPRLGSDSATLREDRVSHYTEMYRLRPLDRCDDVVPAIVKLSDVRRSFEIDRADFADFLGAESLRAVEDAFDEVDEILSAIDKAQDSRARVE